MLIRHPWLAPLLQPPTISEDAEAEAEAEAEAAAAAAAAVPGAGDLLSGGTSVTVSDPLEGVDTADREVARWVLGAMERKKLGKMKGAAKPALHAAPLDAVPKSPGVDAGG